MEQLYKEMSPKLFRYARLKLASKEEAEDIVSETFQAYMAADKGQIDNVQAWLFGVCRNNIYKHYTKPSEEVIVDEQWQAQPDIESEEFEVHEDKQQLTEMLIKHLQTLQQVEQDVLTLKIWEEMTFAQIADVIGKKHNAVQFIYYQALEKLKVAMGERKKSKKLYAFTLGNIVYLLKLTSQAKIFQHNTTNMENLTKIKWLNNKMVLVASGAIAFIALSVGAFILMQNDNRTPVDQPVTSITPSPSIDYTLTPTVFVDLTVETDYDDLNELDSVMDKIIYKFIAPEGTVAVPSVNDYGLAIPLISFNDASLVIAPLYEGEPITISEDEYKSAVLLDKKTGLARYLSKDGKYTYYSDAALTNSCEEFSPCQFGSISIAGDYGLVSAYCQVKNLPATAEQLTFCEDVLANVSTKIVKTPRVIPDGIKINEVKVAKSATDYTSLQNIDNISEVTDIFELRAVYLNADILCKGKKCDSDVVDSNFIVLYSINSQGNEQAWYSTLSADTIDGKSWYTFGQLAMGMASLPITNWNTDANGQPVSTSIYVGVGTAQKVKIFDLNYANPFGSTAAPQHYLVVYANCFADDNKGGSYPGAASLGFDIKNSSGVVVASGTTDAYGRSIVSYTTADPEGSTFTVEFKFVGKYANRKVRMHTLSPSSILSDTTVSYKSESLRVNNVGMVCARK